MDRLRPAMLIVALVVDVDCRLTRNVKQVVWEFPLARNISDFLVETYTTNTSLLHEVQDAVAVALESMVLCV